MGHAGAGGGGRCAPRPRLRRGVSICAFPSDRRGPAGHAVGRVTSTTGRLLSRAGARAIPRREDAVKSTSRYRWFVIFVFFMFMFLHQTDRLMIGSMQVPIMDEFGISDSQWGLMNTGALVVATILYPVWGFLYDRYAR